MDAALAGPLVVRRPKRWGRRLFWLLVLTALSAAALVVVRVAMFSFPVIQAPVRPPGDGWRLLRGMTHVVATSSDEAGTRQVLADAFAARLDFLLLAEPGGLGLAKQLANAPLAVVHAQELQAPLGCMLSVGADRQIDPGEETVGVTFERMRRAGGWSMVVRPLDLQRPFRAWDDRIPDSFQFLNARTQFEGLDLKALLVHYAGWLLGSDAAVDHLGVRPRGALAHWDDYTRKGPVLGYCGTDGGAGAYRIPLTYVFVQDGLGPYGPAEVDSALRLGHHFCALPIYGDPGGFRFLAMPAAGGVVLGNMGDRVELGQGVELIANLHLAEAQAGLVLVLYQDGVEVKRVRGSRLSHKTTVPGSYRIEALVEISGLLFELEERVFVYSNPIFVVDGAPAR